MNNSSSLVRKFGWSRLIAVLLVLVLVQSACSLFSKEKSDQEDTVTDPVNVAAKASFQDYLNFIGGSAFNVDFSHEQEDEEDGFVTVTITANMPVRSSQSFSRYQVEIECVGGGEQWDCPSGIKYAGFEYESQSQVSDFIILCENIGQYEGCD